MRALFIEHDDLSKPGLLGGAFARHGFDIEEFYVVPDSQPATREVKFPALDTVDVVVSMGAPWSVYDPNIVGWVCSELDLLTRADSAGVPVLGVCFGGQLLAQCHGGAVTAAPARELGWTTVDLGEQDLIESGPWFQWHSDRWSVPPGARELATTSVASQAFVLRRNLAVQFHPEVTVDIVDTWIARGGGSIRYDLGELRQQMPGHYAASVGRADRLVANFLSAVATA